MICLFRNWEGEKKHFLRNRSFMQFVYRRSKLFEQEQIRSITNDINVLQEVSALTYIHVLLPFKYLRKILRRLKTSEFDRSHLKRPSCPSFVPPFPSAQRSGGGSGGALRAAAPLRSWRQHSTCDDSPLWRHARVCCYRWGGVAGLARRCRLYAPLPLPRPRPSSPSVRPFLFIDAPATACHAMASLDDVLQQIFRRRINCPSFSVPQLFRKIRFEEKFVWNIET